MTHEQANALPIPISWLSKDDLVHTCPELAERINALAPEEVEYIAEKVGDALQETYWLAVNVVLSDYFGDRGKPDINN